MRPVRITGVVGTSQWVPLDAYTPNRAVVTSSVAALGIEWTADDVFNTGVTPTPVTAALTGGSFQLPEGARAVRGTGMAAPDVMVVSQQGMA